MAKVILFPNKDLIIVCFKNNGDFISSLVNVRTRDDVNIFYIEESRKITGTEI